MSIQGSGLGNSGNERQRAGRHSTSGHTFPFGDSESLAEKAEAPRVHLAKKEVSEERPERLGLCLHLSKLFPLLPKTQEG